MHSWTWLFTLDLAVWAILHCKQIFIVSEWFLSVRIQVVVVVIVVVSVLCFHRPLRWGLWWEALLVFLWVIDWESNGSYIKSFVSRFVCRDHLNCCTPNREPSFYDGKLCWTATCVTFLIFLIACKAPTFVECLDDESSLCAKRDAWMPALQPFAGRVGGEVFCTGSNVSYEANVQIRKKFL